MPLAITHHTVSDYDTWRQAFDEHSAARKNAGVAEATVYRSLEDPNHIYILMDVSDVEAFQKFGQSPELAETMQSAGVTSKPEFAMVEQAG